MSDYLRLIRPAVLAMVLFAMAAAAFTAGESVPSRAVLCHHLLGTGLLIGGALALNQRLERTSDGRMERTAVRPLPSRRLTARRVTWFGGSLSIGGLVYLLVLAGRTAAVAAAASWAIYVLVYTPLKRVTAWQTPVGAIAGAMPMLLGAAAADATFCPMAWVLFGIVYFWQFPHTMAIDWTHRAEYSAAGIKVAPVVDPSGRLAGRLAVLGASCLLAVSLVPAALFPTGWAYPVIAAVLGLVHAALAARFLQRPNDATATALRRISMLHLPALLAALVAAR